VDVELLSLVHGNNPYSPVTHSGIFVNPNPFGFVLVTTEILIVSGTGASSDSYAWAYGLINNYTDRLNLIPMSHLSAISGNTGAITHIATQ